MPEFDRNDYLTTNEVAALWGVTPDAVRKLIRRGRLAALVRPTGRGHFVHRDDVAMRTAGATR